jgi:hypothetical protein
MKEFILAFPLPVSPSECQHWLPKNASLHCPSDNSQLVRFPGIPYAFSWNLQPAHAGLSTVFSEHQPLSLEDAEHLENHQSLLFLQGSLHTKDEFEAVGQAIHILLRSGALGIYMEHSGCAHLARFWETPASPDEPALEGWLNFVQKGDSLYTLGLEAFQKPDLCIHMRHGQPEELQALMTDIADTMFLENLEPDSGLKIQGLEGQSFEFRRETISLHSKGSPYHNPKGTWRLIKD